MKITKIAAALSLIGASIPAFATNGMNMEGYGPVATAMGGASMAYDNGNGGMINNPATLGFMKSGTSRFDMAIGGLHPDVNSGGQGSSADAFFMPAFGYVRKDGNISWGVGMMAQGGMGTEYSSGANYGTLRTAGTGGYGAPANQTAALNQARSFSNMSEVGVGRLIFPVAYSVNDQLNIGGSIDYVWAGMDLQWMMDGAHFFDMMQGAVPLGAKQTFGKINGSFHDAFLAQFGPMFTDLGYGYFDFNRGGKMNQKATGNGWSANVGFTFKATPALTIGAIYHPNTRLSDLDTGSNGARGVFNVASSGALGLPPAGTPMQMIFNGRVKVRNFQWPETYGIGVGYQANDQWFVAADYKRINWASVMKSFNMSFTTESDPTGGAIAVGSVMNMEFYQNWKNQNVLQLGASYKYSDALTLRFGANISDNPVPNSYVTALFPAIIKDQYTAGFGYQFTKASSVDFSMTYAPKVTVTNNWSAVANLAGQRGDNQTISHSQTNWQLMYSHRF